MRDRWDDFGALVMAKLGRDGDPGLWEAVINRVFQ